MLGEDEIRLYGIGLRVEPAHQTVPRDIATIVSTYLQMSALPDGVPPLSPDAVVRATLRGPSFATPRELTISANSPFNIPPMTVAGTHSLDNIRLESGGAILLRGSPESVTLEVIDRLLVTQVTARALSAAEIRERGIVFDQSNFQAYNFSAAFAIEDRKIEINFPVLLPQVLGASDVEVTTATLPTIVGPSLPSLQTIIPDTLRLQTQIPNLSVVGFTMTVPNLSGEQFKVPPIPGVIVIPGDIGFLNQFFSVMLMVGNVAPAGSNLVVDNLRAEIVLPPGYDQVVGSADDPLAMARNAQGETARIQAVVQAGGDGTLGTADDIVTVGPGESGSAEYLVEGRREGSHVVEMEISGTLHGLPIGPVPIRGRAAGAVLVRNPTFTLTFTHPEAVAAGEPYTLDVTVTNTSESPANFVSLSLYPRNISGATIIGEPTRSIESIPPNDSATVSFDLVSRITGKVTAATLDSNENVAGRFGLKAAVGELGVPVSPDSLVLPKEAAALPANLRQAAIGLLGKAWAVATAPAAALPPSIQRFSKKIVIDRAIEVAAAGFRITLHEPAPDSAAQLLMDFAGSQYSRLPVLWPLPGDLSFAQTNFQGFDSLRRASVRGDIFAAAVGAMLAPSLQSSGPTTFHLSLSERWAYRPRFASLLLSSPGPLPYAVTITDAQGRRLGGADADGKFIKQIPYSDVVPIGDPAAGPSAQLLVLTAPENGAYSIAFERVAGVADGALTLSLVLPGADGGLRQEVFNLNPGEVPRLSGGPGDPLQFSVATAATARVADSISPVLDAPPGIMGVLQLPDADKLQCAADGPGYPVGRVVGVLFSEEVTAASVQDKLAANLITNYEVGGNKVVGVALQPGGRIAYIALRDPIGVYIPRELQVSNVMDLRGQAMPAASLPIETVLEHGGVVSGRVIQADGTPVPYADVRLFYLMQCVEPAWVGISAKTADSEGRYSFDFVSADLRDRVVVVNPEEPTDFRSVPFTIARSGQRLNVDVVFLGRGSFGGRTVNESGVPLANTSLRITSLTDQSQYGVTTDLQGRFSVSRVPVGSLFVEAVNTLERATLSISDYIPFAGATVTRDLMLLDVETRETTVQHGALRGHILRADGSTPAGGVPVIVFYEHNSQPGVLCPGSPPPGECAIAMATTASDGRFGFVDVTSGRLRVYAYDQGALSEGTVHFTLAANGERDFAVLLNGGLATVHGIVLDPNGQPVAGTRVGGGLSLSTTNAAGQFTLTDVPIGRRDIVAVSDTLGARGTATIDLVRAGESVNVTIVLGSIGSISGVVYQPDGLTPVANQTVYAFKKAGEGIQVVGQAATNTAGGYRIDHLGVGEYFVSAVNNSLNAGNVVPASLRFHGQVFRADIRFRGAGTVQGVVLDDDGQTPLRGTVGISGEQLVVAGNRVAVEFRHVQYYAVVESNLTTGRFSFPGVWVGNFAITAAGQFSPDPISFDGVVPAPGAIVEVSLRLQATSQVAGVVYRPDGVTPVSAGTIVRYKSDAFRVICSGNAAGNQQCESIPQGIQEETVITGDDGRFWLPIVNAGQFTITVEDVATGRAGEAKGSVRAGERAEMSIRLMGLGDLTVRVMASDGVTPIPNARVRAEQVEHPRGVRTFTGDTSGSVQFAGGDAFSEGTVIVTATDQRNGFSGRASARIERDGQQVTLNVFLFDATGSVSGTLYRSDGFTPVPNAEIVIARQSEPIALLITDAGGRYTSPGIPLGDFQVEAFEAATARRAAGSGRIDLANQDVPINLTQLAIGMVRGTLFLGGPLTPLKAWTVTLNQPSIGGISRPSLQTTSGIDGTYQFPGATQGLFQLGANRSGVLGSASGSGAIVREGQVVDVPLIANVERPLRARLQGLVLDAVGQVAPFITVAACRDLTCQTGVADGTGAFAFDDLPLGRWLVTARSQASASAGSAAADLLVDNDVADVRVVLSGLSTVTGVVERNNGSPAAFAQLTLEGSPSATCGGSTTCTRFADAAGAFSFTDVAAQQFTVTAVDPVSGLRGAVGGTLLASESRNVRIVLQATAQVTGRVFKANGNPAAGITVELHWLLPEGRSLFVSTRDDGRFTFAAAPLVVYDMTIQDPIGPGNAHRTGQLVGDVDLGDTILDEAPPQVGTLDPAPSSTGVPRDQLIRITFTEPIRPGTATPSSITLEGPLGDVTSILEVGDGDRVVTLRPLNPLRDETQYTVRVRPEILDRLGKTMVSEYVASFRTVDITAPRWLDITPAPNSGGFSIYSPIRIPFSEPIAPAAFSTPFELRDQSNALVPGRLDTILGNTVLVFTPNLPLTEDAVYRVRLGTAADLSGNRQATGLDFVVTTTDRTPPQIGGLVGPAGGSVIENDVARVTASVATAHDVGVVDFYINGVMAFADRAAPFELVFQAIPTYGIPGGSIRISAVATDTSGNRGSPVALDVPVVADQPPSVTIVAPASGLQFANGARVVVSVRGTDDLGVTRLAFRAGTGLPQDASSRSIAPSCLGCVENFAFNVPADAAPGTIIPIEASAVDAKGQTTSAAVVNVTVVDSVAPVVAITGATTGARVVPGQSATAVVTAQDAGAVASITFTVAGAAILTETRTVTPAQNSVVTSFTFPIPANAQPGQTVTLDAVAVDRAGNIGTADRVILPVADSNRPTLVLRTSDGGTAAVPGRTVDVTATAGDEIAVNRIELAGQGSFTYNDARQVSPPSGTAVVTFSVPVPANAAPGSLLTLHGRAFDISGNVSVIASLSLTVTLLADLTLPPSVIVAAGESAIVELGLPGGAPAGLRVDLQSTNPAVASVPPFVTFAAGEASRNVEITGVAGGTAGLSALINGVERASMTVTVRGGVVSGRVFDALLNPVSGVTITITGGGSSQATQSDANGDFTVEGIRGPEVEIRALDPVSQHRGFAAAVMARPLGAVAVNLILVPAGRVSGTVFAHDAVTPAGAGARVDIFDVGDSSTPLVTTFTAADGTFDFPLVSVGAYVVRAGDVTGNIGETTVRITATGENRTANVVYLGRGQVTVNVRDGSGNPVSNASLTFYVNTVLGWAVPLQVTGGQDGNYTFANVPVGTFSITGSDPVTARAGSVTGQLTQQGQALTTTITVASFGSVQGTVYRADGVTPVAGARVVANQQVTTITDSDGRFAFPILPLGFVQLVASEPETNGGGITSFSLSTNGQIRNANVTFAAQGTVIATVLDASGVAVVDAQVVATSGGATNPVRSYGRTNVDGVAVLAYVQSGAFVASATNGTRSGSTNGTLAANQTQPITIQLTPTASIAGTLFGPDGVTPAIGSASLYIPGYYPSWVATAQAGADGQFRFDGLQLSAATPTGPVTRPYIIYAHDQAGQRRAIRTGIELRVNDEVQVADLTFVGLGSVHGRVLNPDSSSAAGISVQIRSLHPTFGRSYNVTTDAAGFWEVLSVPVAAFSVRAGDVGRGLLGEAYGTLATHGDRAGADILLQSNAVDLPQTRYDGNNFLFDLQPNGSIHSGSVNAFLDTPTALQRGASLLEVIADGTPTPFTGSAIGTVEDGGREVATRESGVAGLHVTRKVFVPRDGYFARYLETLANPSDQPVTVDVRVRSNVRGPSFTTCSFFSCGWSIQSSSVIATSSGDIVINVGDPLTADRWVVLDDNVNTDPFVTTNIPALAMVFDGAAAATRAGSASFTPGDAGLMEYRWNSLTIPAGGTASLMHFVVQQTTRAGATLAASRLSQLPPEALDGLSPEEVGTIANFAVPAEGVSTLEPLPSLAGTVTGRLFEGDGATPVTGGYVVFRSNHLLFGREQFVAVDPGGRFTFSQVVVEGGSRMVPADSYTVWSNHPVTQVASPRLAGAFVDGALASERDVVFPTGTAAGVVRRHDGTVLSVGFVSISGLFSGSTSIGSDGSFLFRGLGAGAYTFSTTLANPFGTGAAGVSNATIVVGQTANASIVLAPTGSVDGVVRQATGVAAPGALVTLDASGFNRTITADSGGGFRFDEVPVGAYQVSVNEPFTSIATRVDVVVAVDQSTPVTLNYIGLAPVHVLVTRPAGLAMPSARVRLTHTHDFTRTVEAVSGANGIATFQNIPVGSINVLVEHPQLAALTSTASGVVVGPGQQTDLPVVLPPASEVTGTVRLPSNVVAPGMTVRLTSSNSAIPGGLTAVTDATGVFRFNAVPVGTFVLVAQNLSQGLYGSATGEVTTDNGNIASNITLINNVTSLPRDLFDANGFLYDIQSNGTLNDGSGDAYDGGLYLRLIQGGSNLAWNGSGTGLFEDDNREIAIQPQAATTFGLDVRRKIYVPADGYMARYLEVLTNPTAAPITVDVQIQDFLGSDSSTIVVGTSSGDTTFDVADQWIVTDDENGTSPYPNSDPTLAHVMQGTGAVVPLAIATRVSDQLTYRWNGVTVPAGGRAIVMHFAAQHFTQVQGLAVAQRLVQLPPEALAGLDPAERADIVNFVVPADGSSPLAPIAPPPLGTVSGSVRAHDGTTPVPATVTIANTDLYFGRRAVVVTNGIGAGFSAQVLAGDFTVGANRNGTLSPMVNGSFAPGATTATANVVYSNTGGVTGVVRRSDGTPVTAANSYVDVDNNNGVYLGAGGSYSILLLSPGAHVVNAYVPPIGGGSWLRGVAPVTIQAGQTTAADVAIEPTGIVIGVVRRPNGTPVADVRISLSDLNFTSTKNTYSDASGAFRFEDVRAVASMVEASEEINGTYGSTTLTVQANVVQQADVVLSPTGTVTGTVTNPDGSPAVNATVQLSNAVPYRTTQTDAAGVYTFADVAATSCCFYLRASAPDLTDQVYREATGQITTDGQVFRQDFVLPARVTVRVLVVDGSGQPLAGANIYLDEGYRGNTAVDGSLVIPNVGRSPFQLRAYHFTVGIVGYASGTFTDADHGREIEVRIESARSGVIAGSILAGDGVTRIPGFINILDLASGQYRFSQYTESGDYEASVSINSMGYRVEVYPSAAYAGTVPVTGTFAANGDRVVHDFTVPVSVIRGTVRYRDGSPVASPSVFVEGVAPDGSRETFYAARSGADGSYVVFSAGIGTFSVLAQDQEGLIGTAAGEIAAIETPVDSDVVMLAAGTVQGVLRDGSTPLAFNWIAITPSVPLAPEIGTTTDENGAFSFSHVPVGGLTLRACWNNRCATASATLAAEGETVVVTVTLPPAAQVTGIVLAADRVTPVADIEVGLVNPESYSSWTVTDAAGRFMFDGLPDGNFRAIAQQYPSAAAVNIAVLAGRVTDTVLRLGSAVVDEAVLIAGDGFRYDIDCRGRLISGGNGSGLSFPYNSAYRLRLNGQSTGCQSIIGLRESGRQAVIGPASSGGEGPAALEVTRKIFVPESGRFARYLELLRNLTDEVQTITVRIDGTLYSGEGMLLPVTPAATASRYAVTAGLDSSTVVVGHVFSGTGGQLPVVSFEPDNSFFSYEWTVALPPHAAAAFLHFTAQRDGDDVAGADTQSVALSALTDPEALTGLDAFELGLIVNFVAPGGQAAPPGSVSGRVLSAGGGAVADAIVYAIDDGTGRILAKSTSSANGDYRFDNLSALDGIALLALHPDDPLNEARNYVLFSAPGELQENVTLRFDR